LNRPICAVYNSPSGGKLIVTGSVDMFADDYFEKEENQKIFVKININLRISI
jgi:hypothetical protein